MKIKLDNLEREALKEIIKLLKLPNSEETRFESDLALSLDDFSDRYIKPAISDSVKKGLELLNENQETPTL